MTLFSILCFYAFFSVHFIQVKKAQLYLGLTTSMAVFLLSGGGTAGWDGLLDPENFEVLLEQDDSYPVVRSESGRYEIEDKKRNLVKNIFEN